MESKLFKEVTDRETIPLCAQNCNDENKSTYSTDLVHGSSNYFYFSRKKYYAKIL